MAVIAGATVVFEYDEFKIIKTTNEEGEVTVRLPRNKDIKVTISAPNYDELYFIIHAKLTNKNYLKVETEPNATLKLTYPDGSIQQKDTGDEGTAEFTIYTSQNYYTLEFIKEGYESLKFQFVIQ